MTAAAIALTLFIVYSMVLAPIGRANELKAQRDFQRAMRYVKLRAVRRYYPALSKLSYQEIEDSFDVDHAYDAIGRQ